MQYIASNWHLNMIKNSKRTSKMKVDTSIIPIFSKRYLWKKILPSWGPIFDSTNHSGLYRCQFKNIYCTSYLDITFGKGAIKAKPLNRNMICSTLCHCWIAEHPKDRKMYNACENMSKKWSWEMLQSFISILSSVRLKISTTLEVGLRVRPPKSYVCIY